MNNFVSDFIAVMIQVWTALMTILILKFLKALAKYLWQRSNLIAFIRLNLFVKIDLKKWLDKPFDHPPGSKTNNREVSLIPATQSRAILLEWLMAILPLNPDLSLGIVMRT